MKKFVFIFSVLLAALFVTSIIVNAETIYTYNGYSYTYLDNGFVSICGWDNSSNEFVVPEKISNKFVYEIDRKGMQKNTFIVSVDFSQATKLLTIGGYAFEGCSSLVGELFLPNKIGFIGDAAFMNCSSLDTVDFRANTDSVPRQIFKDCTSLNKAIIGAGPTEIEAYAFENCVSLKSITIPKTITSINSTAFKGCSDFTIKCYRNSYTMQYAIDNGINYEILDPLIGDVNGDEEITIMDATIIQKKSLGIATADVVSNYDVVADVNRDGIVNIRDVTLIQMYVAGIITEF